MNKRQLFSILMCVCMVLTLMPMSALAAAHDSWETATAEGVTLSEGDTVRIGGTDYIYKVNADTTGIKMYTMDEYNDATALTEACFWTAGDGYVLYKPTLEENAYGAFTGTFATSAEVTLHNAEINTADTSALALPSNSSGPDSYPVPVTVRVEGTNSLTTTNAYYNVLSHSAGDTTFTGGGTLSIIGQVNTGEYYWNQSYNDTFTIESGTQVAYSGGASSQIAGNLTVTGNGSKLTIADGATLPIGSWGGAPKVTVTVEEGAVLENNGTLRMVERVDKNNSHIVGEISGSGGIMLDNTMYTMVDGEFIPYGGDVSTSGLNLSGTKQDGTADAAYNAPTVETRYKAGNGYILFTPATADPAAHAKLELNNADISTISGRALFLPASPVDITVTGDNSLTANGSYNFAIDPNGQAVSITGDGSLTLTGYKGIASWNGSASGITIDIGGDLVAPTNYDSLNTDGNVDISAASISTGIIRAGNGSFTAAAKTGDLTIDNRQSNSMAVLAGNGVALQAANGAISLTGKGSGLMESSGTITMNAKGDITLTGTDTGNDAIRFDNDVSIASSEGSIGVTTSGYSCIEKISNKGTVTLNAAKDVTLNADYTAVSASGQDVSITAGGKLSSTSSYGFQVGVLTIKANEVSVTGTQQDGIYASSVSITNTDGTSNCKRVSITGSSSSENRAAIQANGNATVGNITVKAEDLFICGKGSAKAVKALGTVTIGDAGLIAGAISAGTDNISAGVTRVSQTGADISSSGLDLTAPPTETTIYPAGNGYARFTPAVAGDAPVTLEFHNAEVSGNITLPEHAAIKTTAASTINGNISPEPGNYCDLTLSGVEDLTVNGSISVGVDGTVNVTGADTEITVSSSSDYGVQAETVNVGSGASLTAKAEGENSIGVKTMSGGVHVTGGSTLTAGCDYGVYIIGGKLEVDGSSKLITSGTVAPFCIVDTTSAKSQNDVLSLPGKPDGTAFKSVTGTTDFIGTNYTYWSLTDGGNLTVSQENSIPAALTGAKTGTLTFVKAASTGGSSSGSGSGKAGTTTESTVPSTTGKADMKVTATVKDSTATISMTDAQMKEIASDTGNVGKILLDVSNQKVDTVVIPAKIVSAAGGSADAAGFELALPAGTVALDKSALAAVSGKGDVKVSIETVSQDKLTDTQKAVLGTQAGSAVIVDVNIDVNGVRTGTFGGGTLNISVPYTLKAGESADSITVWFVRDDGTIEPKNGKYNAETGRVEFTTDHLSQYLIVKFPFADVAEKAWYYGSVAYAWNNGLFSGTSETSFTPGAAMTRQMIWMVLARMDGKAPANMEESRAWAVENKISDGTNPKNSITRGQMAAILYRYAQYKGYDTTQGGMAIREFADYKSIPAYAQDAMGWTVNAGLIQGSGDKLMPQGSATRAQVAAILQRFSTRTISSISSRVL